MADTSKYDLIGYVLDTLDDAERETIAAAEAADEQLASTIEQLRAGAGAVREVGEGLRSEAGEAVNESVIEATLAQVRQTEPVDWLGYALGVADDNERRRAADMEADDSEQTAFNVRLQERLSMLESARVGGPDLEPSDTLVEQTLSEIDPNRPAPMPFTEGGGPRRLRMVDALVAACLVLMVSGLLVPALNQARQQARVEQCAQNLHQIGVGMLAYMDQSTGWVPVVQASDTAGEFAVMLVERQIIENPTLLYCSQSDASGYPVSMEVKGFAAGSYRAAQRLRDGSGDYGFSLGFQSSPASQPVPRNVIPLVSDAPYRSANDSLCSEARSYLLANSANHAGTGQNVLFADGSVRFLETRALGPMDNDIFLNQHGDVRAGTSARDAVLGFGTDRP